MGIKMTNAPIFYTLAQIRFSPVLDMAEYIPQIHKELRRDFPEIRSEQLTQFKMNVGAESKEPITSRSAPRWNIENFEKNAGYTLFTDSLTYQTTAYETSEVFADALIHGLEVLDAAVGLGFVQSVGVRTLDAVVPGHDESLSLYINNQLLGFCGLIPDGKMNHNITESVVSISGGSLVARVIVSEGDLGLPVDLFPIPLTLNRRFQSITGLHAVLDFDRNEKTGFKFSVEEIRQRIRLMKQGATEIFYKTVTKEALAQWK